MVKRGFFFWVELMFLIIVITIALLSLPQSKDNFLKTKARQDSEKLGEGTLRSLDQIGLLRSYIDYNNFSNSNFTALAVYIGNSLPSTVQTSITYFNGSACYSESGNQINCSNISVLTKDSAVAEYIFAQQEPVLIRIYLRRIFA